MRDSMVTGDDQIVGRVKRIDRGWSTFLCVQNLVDEEMVSFRERRVRNLGVDVAVGDWIVVAADGERIIGVVPRQSRLVRRASSEGMRYESQTIAANIDVVFSRTGWIRRRTDVASNVNWSWRSIPVLVRWWC